MAPDGKSSRQSSQENTRKEIFRRKRATGTRLGEKYFIPISLAPALAFIFLFTLYPLLFAVYVSFQKLDLRRPNLSGFIGADNYVDVFTRPEIQSSWAQTFIFAVMAVGIVVTLSLAFAILLNQTFRGSGCMQVLVLVPWAIPYVVSGTIWKWIFDPNFGLANELLFRAGLIDTYQPFIVQQWPAMFILLLAYVWVETPLPTLLFFAALQSVPQELYEQAKIDGASAWHRFRKITFKWIRPIFFIILVYETLMDIRAFDLVFVVTAGGPADFTALISFFTYREAFVNLNFGRATALSLTLVAISMLLIYLYYRFLKVGRLRLRIR